MLRAIVGKNSFELVKVKIKFSVEQNMAAQRGSKGIVLLFL
jgi:hypothetical protein